jgi:ApaG protein
MELTSAFLVDQDIAISVATHYMERKSNPDASTYAFAYTISIRNDSEATVQLLARHWDILDGYGGTRSVSGVGVIGQKPVLAPGESHTYSSGCSFECPIGRMSGYYIFYNLDTRTEFRVRIPAFMMTYPPLLN